jgi:tetratricopeptide (TPR) repeat protein
VKQEKSGKGAKAKVVKEEWSYDKFNLVVTLEADYVTKVDFTKPYVPTIDSSDYKLAVAEYEKAITLLKKGMQQAPSDQEISENLMNAYIGAEKNEEARGLLDDRVKKYPDSKYDRYNLGVFLLKDKAVYNLAATYVNWGVAEQERLKKEGKEEDKSYQEKFKLAIPHLEKVIEEKADDIQILELLGQVYANLGQNEKAKAAYDKADAIRKERN